MELDLRAVTKSGALDGAVRKVIKLRKTFSVVITLYFKSVYRFSLLFLRQLGEKRTLHRPEGSEGRNIGLDQRQQFF